MEKNLPKACIIEAPCKINLHLRIGERRPSGFHDVESIFAALALADTLRFDRAEGVGINAPSENAPSGSVLFVSNELAGSWRPRSRCLDELGISPEPEDNLVLRAVSLFREKTGFRAALRIRLDKRIPAGAGLGGGSSDAASTLSALNLLAGQPLGIMDLSEMAGRLGSDVPFFLAGSAAFVCGRGDQVEPIPPPAGLWVILVKPPFASGTAQAYRLLDEARAAFPLCAESPPKENLIKNLSRAPQAWPFQNDFLPVFLGRNEAEAAAYRDILSSLRRAGALFAGLSGSGSCCFGVFAAKEAAQRAESEISAAASRQEASFGKKNIINLTFFLAQKAKPILEW
ncbi:MAG: 4-(cytidine 5'-diphospho)-2-C-methyl-D-erythritol kinase [Treponema sp.]|nr:4-(cytidine 5'-diphospho)-2-C-methyl-D-erythritol kinase [Treponema sp.]